MGISTSQTRSSTGVNKLREKSLEEQSSLEQKDGHWSSLDTNLSTQWIKPLEKPLPIGSMYAIYGNIYHQYTPNVSIYIYIYHTWILWVGIMAEVKIFPVEIPQWIHPLDQLANISNHNRLVLSESVILESPSWNMHPKISQKIGESQKLKPLFTGNHGFSRKYNWLVVWTPLKNMKVSWDYYSNIWKNKKMFQSPPTR